ncbi:lantibiotic dehydratase C-terminal domain-containing protein [Sphaerisporangium sp. NPDC004334]
MDGPRPRPRPRQAARAVPAARRARSAHGRVPVAGAAAGRLGRRPGRRAPRRAQQPPTGPPPYAARSRAPASVAGDLAACAEAGRLTRPLTALAGGFLHMHANRMLPSAARAQELVLYDFLGRWYRSRAGRRLNGAGAATARPAADAPR